MYSNLVLDFNLKTNHAFNDLKINHAFNDLNINHAYDDLKKTKKLSVKIIEA